MVALYDSLFSEERLGELKEETAQKFKDASTFYQAMAHHGSGAGFDRFNTESMGSGEGRQNYGWGLYFSSSKDIAKSYAEKLGEEGSRNLYDVIIDGDNWLNWDGVLSENNEMSIRKALEQNGYSPERINMFFKEMKNERLTRSEWEAVQARSLSPAEMEAEFKSYEYMYDNHIWRPEPLYGDLTVMGLKKLTGSPKAASMLLKDAG